MVALDLYTVLAPHMELLKKLFVSTAHADKGIYTIKFNKNGKVHWQCVEVLLPLLTSLACMCVCTVALLAH